MLWRDMRGRTKEENHKELQDLNPQEFPSLRGYFVWWKDRSRTPLSFPLKRCKKYGRNGEREQATQGQQWRRERGSSNQPKLEEGDLL
jgi:hypothetical protein